MIVIECPSCKKNFKDHNYEHVIRHGSGIEDDIYKCSLCGYKFKLNLHAIGKGGYGFITGKPLNLKEKVLEFIKTVAGWISL